MFFFDAAGGTGTTFVNNAILAYVRSSGRLALPVAASGIAALLLDGGRTVHSRFKVPIVLHDLSTCNIVRGKNVDAALVKACDLIIWDEVPMQHQDVLSCRDRCLQDICDVKILFAGKVVVFSGDFRQVREYHCVCVRLCKLSSPTLPKSAKKSSQLLYI